MKSRDNWGWRARLGLFIVASEAVPEAAWWAMMPPGVSVHASRISAPAPWASWLDDGDSDVRLAADLDGGARHCLRIIGISEAVAGCGGLLALV